MVRAAALAFLLQFPSDSHVKTVMTDNEIMWNVETTEGDNYLVLYGQDTRYTDGSVKVWVNGEHSKNPKVRYRRSQILVSLSCRGTFEFDAITTFAADGSQIESADSPPGKVLTGTGTDPWRTRSIRPFTVFERLQTRLCQKQK